MPDDGNEPDPSSNERWRELADKASKERDPKKLLETISQLCDALDARAAAQKRPQDPICPTATETRTDSGD